VWRERDEAVKKAGDDPAPTRERRTIEDPAA
jgi:hypothetical protein